MKVFYGNSNRELGEKILSLLKIKENQVKIKKFADGESKPVFETNLRGKDVFIIQSTNPPDKNLMELLLMIDAARRSSAKRITAVIPYFGYARQDRKDEPHVPISAKLVADLITAARANRVLSLDIHTNAIQGFFNIPFDGIYASWFFIPVIKQLMQSKKSKTTAPDVGASARAYAYAKLLNLKTDMTIINKRRKTAGIVDNMTLIGKIEKHQAIIIDDIADSCGTLSKASLLLKEKGSTNIIAAITHPVMSKNAFENLSKSNISKLLISDTIPYALPKKINNTKIQIVSCANLLAKCITAIHKEKSVSQFFLKSKNS